MECRPLRARIEIDLKFESGRFRDDPIAVTHILILVIFSMYLYFDAVSLSSVLSQKYLAYRIVIPGKPSATRNHGFSRHSGFRLSPE